MSLHVRNRKNVGRKVGRQKRSAYIEVIKLYGKLNEGGQLLNKSYVQVDDVIVQTGCSHPW